MEAYTAIRGNSAAYCSEVGLRKNFVKLTALELFGLKWVMVVVCGRAGEDGDSIQEFGGFVQEDFQKGIISFAEFFLHFLFLKPGINLIKRTDLVLGTN